MAPSLRIAALSASLLASGAARCPALPPLRSPAVKANFSVSNVGGLWYENRYTDPAQIGARCQRMNKTGLSDGSIDETYEVYYGDVPFPLPLVYNASGGERGVFSRYMSLAPFAAFPSVVVDFDVVPGGTSYSALVEFLCWDAPLNITYIEFRISTRDPSPSPAYLDSLEARARALGVNWSLPLHNVNFTGCPAWNPKAVAAAEVDWSEAEWPQWALKRAAVAKPLAALEPQPQQEAPPGGAAEPDLILPGTRPGLPQLAVIFVQASRRGRCSDSGEGGEAYPPPPRGSPPPSPPTGHWQGAEVEVSAYAPFLKTLQAVRRRTRGGARRASVRHTTTAAAAAPAVRGRL